MQVESETTSSSSGGVMDDEIFVASSFVDLVTFLVDFFVANRVLHRLRFADIWAAAHL
jgi:hypothetical protein